MKNQFTSSASRFLLGTILVAIIASFIFTGYQSTLFQSPNVVATVNGLPVKRQEFKSAVAQQMKFYEQFMGGQFAGQQQMIEMLQKSVLNRLIQEKLMLSFGESLKLTASKKQVADEIKKLPYFIVNGQFSVDTYKKLLEANGLTPQEFEDSIAQQLSLKMVEILLANVPVSNTYAKDILKIKSEGVEVALVKIKKEDLRPLIKVTPQEIDAYLADSKNQPELEQLYKAGFGKYNKPEEVKISHILFRGAAKDQQEAALAKAKELQAKINVKNFAEMAKKYSEDPTSKDKAGDIGWIARGMMNPDFENAAFSGKRGEVLGPVKSNMGIHFIVITDNKKAVSQPLEIVKPELAKQAIQKTKNEDLAKIIQNTKSTLPSTIEKNISAVDSQYSAYVVKEAILNKLDRQIGDVKLDQNQALQIFGQYKNGKQVLTFETAQDLIFVATLSTDLRVNDKIGGIKEVAAAQNMYFTQKLKTDLVENLQKKAKVVTYENAL